MMITILEPGFFISEETLLPIDVKENEKIVKAIPQQLKKDVKMLINDMSSSASSAIVTAGSTNVVVAQLIGGSVQVFWGMMRALQIIVLKGLINNPVPAHLSSFMKTLLNMAQYDIFDAGGVYRKTFDFKETSSMNENFELFGIEGKNFMVNSGSFFPFVIIILSQQIFEMTMQRLAILLARLSCCRLIGTKLYRS